MKPTPSLPARAESLLESILRVPAIRSLNPIAEMRAIIVVEPNSALPAIMWLTPNLRVWARSYVEPITDLPASLRLKPIVYVRADDQMSTQRRGARQSSIETLVSHAGQRKGATH